MQERQPRQANLEQAKAAKAEHDVRWLPLFARPWQWLTSLSRCQAARKARLSADEARIPAH